MRIQSLVLRNNNVRKGNSHTLQILPETDVSSFKVLNDFEPLAVTAQPKSFRPHHLRCYNIAKSERVAIVSEDVAGRSFSQRRATVRAGVLPKLQQSCA